MKTIVTIDTENLKLGKTLMHLRHMRFPNILSHFQIL